MICAFVIRMQQNQAFLRWGPFIEFTLSDVIVMELGKVIPRIRVRN